MAADAVNPGNDAAWRDFEALVRVPTAVAFEVLDLITRGEVLPPLTPMPDETVSALCQILRATGLASSPSGAGVFSEAAARGLPAAIESGQPTAVDNAVTAALSSANQTLITVWQSDSSAQRSQLDDMTAEEAMLAALPDSLPADRLREIGTARVDVAMARAGVHAALGESGAALDAWQRALAEARTVDLLGAGNSLTLSTVTRYCEWIGGANPDAALRELLPEVEQVISGPAAIQRVELLVYLCRFYLEHGDEVAARAMVQRLETELGALGLLNTSTGDYLDVVSGWVAAAVKCASTHNGRIKAVHGAVSGWLTVLASRFQLARESGPREARIDRLGSLFQEMAVRQAAVEQRDQQLIEAKLKPPDIPSAPAPPDFSVAQQALETFTALMDRFNGGETSDDLVTALRALAAEPTQPPDRRGWSALRAAEILSGRKQWDAARPDLESAIALANSAADLDIETQAWELLIIEQLARRDFPATSQLCGRAIDRIEEVRRHIGTPYLASGFMRDRTMPYLAGIDAAYRGGDWQLMLQRTELLRAAALQAPAPRHGPDTPLSAELRQLSRDAAGAADPEGIRARRRLVWERMLIENERVRPAFDLAALQQLIAGRAVVLAYFFVASALFRMCITGQSLLCEKLTLEEDAEFFVALDRISHATSGSPSLESDLRAVATTLLPDAFAADLEAAQQVIVCPHQPLHQVPFGALPFAGTTLIERKPVGVVPNLTCLLAPNDDPGSRTTYFGIGSRNSLDSHHQPMAKLDGAEREVRQVAQLFGASSSVLLGPKATRDAVESADTRQSLGSARVVHLALHGSDVADKDIADAPMEARLYLSDGPIDGLDIMTWSMNADVVVLSACHAAKRADSARGLVRLPDDTVFGLQAAFHQAGARAVIGPLWAVADQVAPEVIRPLCAGLRDGKDPAAALHHAICAYLAGAAGTWRSPALWGCFTLVAFTREAFGLSPATS